MDQFGVKKPSLKAIARTPVIPALQVTQNATKGKRRNAEAAPKNMTWMGVTLTELTGEAFSAYGVSKIDGGVALSDVTKDSPAAKAGLLEGDLIQAVNGRNTPNMTQFNKVIRKANGTVTLKVVRNQQETEVKVTL
jgi:S1-C subfamily serine protease